MSRSKDQGLTSIVILTYNKLDYNMLCIESIRQYTEPDAYEIIVVDNNSADGTVEWLKSQQDIQLILNSENVGFPAGCNQGIKAARGDSILLLNNDTVVTPRWLDNLKQCLFSAEDIGAVGAVTNSCSNFQSIPCEYSSIEEMIRFADYMNNSDPKLWEERTRLVGYCMLIKAEVIAKIGLLDEAFSPGNYEDDDYSVRIRKAGYRLLLCRDTFIHHFGSVSFGEDNTCFNNLLASNRQKFTAKWGKEPHCIAPYEPTRDLGLRKWIGYQHEVGYYQQLMKNNERNFWLLAEQAEFALLSGNGEKAMLLAKQAADGAHHSHPGFFASAKLEGVLGKFAQKLHSQAANPAIAISKPDPQKRNILHVLSQGYFGGGHTATLARWIDMDTESVHSLLVTLQSTTNPPGLAKSALASGGWYNTLDTQNLTLSQRARLLHAVANMWADIVVLHIHPHDPVPTVAFGIAGGPPVVFVNHADHAFSLGMTVADLVAEHRAGGQFITQKRRSAAASYVLPVPLGPSPELQARETAKAALGIEPDKIVLLTIAPPYKLLPCGEYNFAKLLGEIVNRQQQVEILVVGPPEAGEWARLKSESNGRIRTFAGQQDLVRFYSAADVYVDSLPLGSADEALAAAVLGIPVVGLAVDIATHFCEDIAPDIVKTHFHSRGELLAVIDRLVLDEAYRAAQGAVSTRIHKQHFTEWTGHLRQLYSLLPDRHEPGGIRSIRQQPADGSDVVWTYFQNVSGLNRSRFG
ncbi:glycosyltransferase [Sporomusa sp. GT1]|uniref:glycosyltransferase n=1 Tax=Sporomusa TaxID=2375 RepID=UPI001CB7D7A3|nr:glycosyltransferase [Sporomusa sp. GT1]